MPLSAHHIIHNNFPGNDGLKLGQRMVKIGAALVKWPKYFFLLITMKLASLVEIAMLIIYHQGTKENF
jgi:hypothetical protein